MTRSLWYNTWTRKLHIGWLDSYGLHIVFNDDNEKYIFTYSPDGINAYLFDWWSEI